jgi:hypothetical protein
MGRRITIVLAVIFLTGIVASYVDWTIQELRVRHAVQTIGTLFPQGMSVADAKRLVDSLYPQHTNYSPAGCERWSHSTPPYTPRGGPCQFGIVRIGATWWGYQSAVMFRLIFAPDNRLAQT